MDNESMSYVVVTIESLVSNRNRKVVEIVALFYFEWRSYHQEMNYKLHQEMNYKLSPGDELHDKAIKRSK